MSHSPRARARQASTTATSEVEHAVCSVMLGAAQIELVGGPGAEEVLIVGQHQLVTSDRFCKLWAPKNVGKQIGVHRTAGVDTDRPLRRLARVSGCFQCLPATFEEQAVLWIENLRFARRHAEETGIEHVRVGKVDTAPHVGRITTQRVGHAGDIHFSVREGLECVDAVRDQAPIGFDVRCARKATRHTDDGDGVGWEAFGGVGIRHVPAFPPERARA
jgi:hypothetical protein